MLINMLGYAAPLLLCSIGALFSEYAGVLALFLEGMISFSAFMTYHLTIVTASPVLGMLLTVLICVTVSMLFMIVIQLCHGHIFISAISMNLLFSSIISFFSYKYYGTRGVLTSTDFNFNLQNVQICTVILSTVLIIAGILFLVKSRHGLYIRITGSDSDVLLAKGVNPVVYKVLSWGIAALYASVAGGLLTFRLSSFVPNISSGRGWMALAAVFLGRKNPIRIVICVLVFCFADNLAASVQNIFEAIPSSVIISLPYIVALLMISFSSDCKK